MSAKEEALTVALDRLARACESDPDDIPGAVAWAKGTLNASLSDLRKAQRRGPLAFRQCILDNIKT